MPSEINPETLDYLRIQLEDQVRPNVETALFRYYRNLGSAIVAVLSVFGISLGWPALKGAVQNEVRQQVKQPVADAEESVKKQQVDIENSLRTTDAHLETARTLALKMESKVDEINDSIARAKLKALNLEDDVKSVSSTVTANVARMEALGNKYASYGAVDTLTQQLSALSDQVNSINKALNQLAQAAGKTNAIIDAQGVTEKLAAIQKQAKTFVATSDGDSRTTVYVQFPVSTTRQEIVQLTNKLRKDVTLQIPGEEQIATAEGKHEIRYFYKEDEQAANALKAETESAVTNLGYQLVSIDLIPLLSFSAKPKHKVIELWLELPKKK